MDESDRTITQAQWDELTEAEKLEWARLLKRSDYELRQLLAINECPQHGECIPYTRGILMRNVLIKEQQAENLNAWGWE